MEGTSTWTRTLALIDRRRLPVWVRYPSEVC
jgi:hypothetical protein